MWWVKGDHAPPLVTTGLPAFNGILGPGTAVLFGGHEGSITPTYRSGIRVGGGYWLDPCGCWAVDGSFFTLPEVRGGTSVASSPLNGNPLIARPFVALNFVPGAGVPTPGEFSEVLAGPGTTLGALRVDTSSELWGGDANLRRNLYTGCFARLDALIGFRYASLRESLSVTEMVLAPPQAPDILAAVGTDSFRTRNDFYGGQLGLTGEARYGRWFVNGYAKVALGNTHESVDISGGQLALTTRPGVVSAANGNLLALPSNINHYERDKFSVLPEGGVNLGYHVTERLRVYTGYSFLFWGPVARPGEQIDRGVDVTQIPNFVLNPPATALPPGVFRPAAPFRDKGFWAQGITFGLEFNW
jgi:hypothetical protein